MKSLRVALLLLAGLLSSPILPAATTTGVKKPVTATKPVTGKINTDAVVDISPEAAKAVVAVPPRDDDDELTTAHGGDEPMTKKEYRYHFGKDPDPSFDVPAEKPAKFVEMPSPGDKFSPANKPVTLKPATLAELKSVADRFEQMKPAPEIHFDIIRTSETGLAGADVPSGLLTAALYIDKPGELTGELVLENFSDADSIPTTYLLQLSTRAPSGRLLNPVRDWSAPLGLVYMEPRGLNPVFVPFASDPSPGDNVNNGNAQLMHEAFARNTTHKVFRCEFPISSKILVPALKTSGQGGGLLYVRLVPVQKKGAGGKTFGRITKANLQEALIGGPVNDTKITKREADQLQASPAATWEPVAPPTAWRPAFIAESQITKGNRDTLNNYKKEFTDFEQAVNSGYTVTLVGYVPPKLTYDEDANFQRLDFYELTRDVSFKGNNWKKGQHFQMSIAQNRLKAKSGWAAVGSDLWDLVTGTIHMASSAYESVKAAAVSVVSAALNATGVDALSCGEQCRKNLLTGLNIALSACGLPPTIPDVGQIYANGADYLAMMVAETIVEQTVGVDLGEGGDFAKAQLQQQAQKAARQGVDALTSQLAQLTPGKPYSGDDPSTWGVPSSAIRPHPAMLYVEVKRTGFTLDQLGETTDELNLEIIRNYSGDKTKNPRMFLYQKTYPLFFPAGSSSVIIPVVLTIDPAVAHLFSDPDSFMAFTSDGHSIYNSGISGTRFGQPTYVTQSSGLLSGKVVLTTTHRAPGKTVKSLFLKKTWPTKKPSYQFGNTFTDGKTIYGYTPMVVAP
jgi:hypothetical protein